MLLLVKRKQLIKKQMKIGGNTKLMVCGQPGGREGAGQCLLLPASIAPPSGRKLLERKKKVKLLAASYLFSHVHSAKVIEISEEMADFKLSLYAIPFLSAPLAAAAAASHPRHRSAAGDGPRRRVRRAWTIKKRKRLHFLYLCHNTHGRSVRPRTAPGSADPVPRTPCFQVSVMLG